MDVFKTLILDTPTQEGGGGTVTSVDLTAGTGISVSGGPITSSGSITVTNTAPDQTVSIASGTGISVTGTYPSFTVTNSSPSLGGDVVGPASATDNAVVRFDSTTGKLVQNSGVSISDANLLTTTALTVNDNTTLGSSNTDTVTFNARSASEFTPAADDTYDLGRVGHEWRDLFINGTANIDSLVADTADVSGNLAITGAGSFILGDWTNTIADRPTFKTSVTNGGTYVQITPDGTGVASSLNIFGTSDVTTNAFRLGLTADSTSAAKINALAQGAATVRNLQLQVQSSTICDISSTGLAVTGSIVGNNGLNISGAPVNGTTGINLESGVASSAYLFRAYNRTSAAYAPIDVHSSTWNFSADGGATTAGSFSSTGLAVTGTMSTTDELRITNTGGIKYILMGNQDSGGTNKPSVIRAANGNTEIGYGNSWSSAGGGTVTTVGSFTSTGLDVTGSIGAKSGGVLQLWDSANADYAYINNTGSSLATQSISYYSAGSGSVAHQFKTYSGGVVNALAITPAGDVGIGTTSPGSKLQVNGDIRIRSATTGAIRWSNDDSSTWALIQYDDSNGNLSVGTPLGRNYNVNLTVNGSNVAVASSTGLDIAPGNNFNARASVSNGASSSAPTFWQSGEPGVSVSNVILSNNYYGVTTGGSGRVNTSTGGSFVRLRENGSINLSSVSSGGTVATIAEFSSAGLDVTGAITATGNITAYYSDDRLKTKLGNIENALDKVSKLNGFYYEANETAQALGYKPVREVGLSAQQVEAVLPEVVAPAPIDNEYKTLHYERVIPLLVEAIKELKAEIELLKK